MGISRLRRCALLQPGTELDLTPTESSEERRTVGWREQEGRVAGGDGRSPLLVQDLEQARAGRCR